MSEQQELKTKKSVALSGVVAGNTAICTVGQSGNDLHYRGYEIAELAAHAAFGEVAYLLLYGRLPKQFELNAYRVELQKLRGLPGSVKTALQQIPAAAHPMDVLRTACSVLGTVLPEKDDHSAQGARDIAERLLASFGSMLLYWYHFSHSSRRIEVETDDLTVASHFLRLLHGTEPSPLHVRALDQSLVLYAEHEFNASTFAARVIAGTGSDFYSAVTGAIGALRGPKHGGANEAAIEIIQRYATPDEAEEDIRERLDHQAHRPRVVRRRRQPQPVRDCRTHRDRDVAAETDVPQPGLVQCRVLSDVGDSHADVHAAVRDGPDHGLGRPHHRTARRRQDHPSQRELHRPRRTGLYAHRETGLE